MSQLIDITGNKYGRLTVLHKDFDRKANCSSYWVCKCDCGNIVSVRASSLTRKDENRTISCGCAHKSSGEIYIEQILINNNIKYRPQYFFEEIPKYKYDFAILQNGLPIRLVEFDGEGHYMEIDYWRGSLEIRLVRDKKKNELAKKHNIPLVRIPYWERDKITLEMIMGDRYLVKEEEKE